MTVIAHFINVSWNLQSGVLSTFHFGEQYTAVNLAARVTAKLERFGITSKVSAIVHGEATNVKKATALLHEGLRQDESQLDDNADQNEDKHMESSDNDSDTSDVDGKDPSSSRFGIIAQLRSSHAAMLPSA